MHSCCSSRSCNVGHEINNNTLEKDLNDLQDYNEREKQLEEDKTLRDMELDPPQLEDDDSGDEQLEQ